MGPAHESPQCPSCGHDDFDPEKQCLCGYHADESFIVESFIMESGSSKNQNEDEVIQGKSLANITRLKSSKSSEEIIIKEIDSWVFSFSPRDNCIYLGTPALKSFCLKLSLTDLEELLDFIYKKAGVEKTVRKLRLSEQGLRDLMDKAYRIIEDKRSKIALTFTNAELQEIANLIKINLKV